MASTKILLTLLAYLCVALALAGTPVGKRGLSFNNPSTYIQRWNDTGSQVTWAYNWGSNMDTIFPSKTLQYVPMLWGNATQHTGNWNANVKIAQSRGSKQLLAFNEPDGCGWGQSCLSPAAAAEAYMKWMMPYAANFSLGAPAVTNGPAPGGLAWLSKFLTLCTKCKIDFVPIHWYDKATNVAYFQKYMNSSHIAAGGRDIWITEFNGRGTPAEQTTFMKNMLPWLDSQRYIARYAWQWCSPTYTGGALVLNNGTPTALGKIYGWTPY